MSVSQVLLRHIRVQDGDALVVAEVGAESDVTGLLEASREGVSRTGAETSCVTHCD